MSEDDQVPLATAGRMAPNIPEAMMRDFETPNACLRRTSEAMERALSPYGLFSMTFQIEDYDAGSECQQTSADM